MAAEPPEDGGRFGWVRRAWNYIASPQKDSQQDPAAAAETPAAAQKVRSIRCACAENPRLRSILTACVWVTGRVHSRSRDYLQRYPRPPSPARPPRV